MNKVKKPSNFLDLHKWNFLLAALIVVYSVLLGKLSLMRHWSLGSYYYDLGIMHQVVYNTAHGLFLQMTDPNTTEQISRFAIHFDPLMIIFSPFYWLFPHAETLLVGQTLFLASGAIPVYLLAAHVFKKVKSISPNFIGIFFAFLYLNYFPLQKTNIFDFHAVALVTSLLLWAFYFIETGRYRYAIPLLLLSLFGKENTALVVFMIGLYIALVKKNRGVGFGLSAICIAFFLFIIGYVIPSSRAGQLHFAESYFTTDIAENLRRLFSEDRFKYVFQLLKPLGFLPLLSPLYLILAAPEWAINLLSSNNNMRDLQYHYSALLTPFLIISSIYGVRSLITTVESVSKKADIKQIIIGLLAIVFTLNIYTTIQSEVIFRNDKINKNRLHIVKELNSRFDSTTSVSATGHLAPYFSGRQYFHNFLFDFAYGNFFTEDEMKQKVTRYESAEYVVIQEGEVDNKHPLVKYYYNHLITNPKYQKVFDKEGIEVYKRVTPKNYE